MLYEFRTYQIYPGRMDAIHKRFKEHGLGLLKAHDLKVVGMWESICGEKLHYILVHQDMQSRERNFEAFMNDPLWIEAKRLSELDGPIVKDRDISFMERVPYFPETEGK